MIVDIEMELRMARNVLGKLGENSRARVQAVIDNPCQETWNQAYSVIVGSDGWLTLWQAVHKVRPGFPMSKPANGEWAAIPDRNTLVAALRYATH